MSLFFFVVVARYSFAQVLACTLMCIGLIWFTLADSAMQPNFNLWGQFQFNESTMQCNAIVLNFIYNDKNIMLIPLMTLRLLLCAYIYSVCWYGNGG